MRPVLVQVNQIADIHRTNLEKPFDNLGVKHLAAVWGEEGVGVETLAAGDRAEGKNRFDLKW